MEQLARYERNFLTEVSLKIEFEEEIKLNQDTIDKDFKEILKERFPVAAFEKNMLKDGEYHGKMWIFQKRNKQILLNESSIELVYYEDSYNCKEELMEDVRQIYKVLKKNRIDDAKYIKLRFINEIRPKNGKIENLEEWINPQLINLDFKSENYKIIRAMSRFEYIIDEDFYLYFQFGQFNENYPLPHIYDNFILDYEACIKYADTRYLREEVSKMHGVIKKFFQDSIGDELIKEMGEMDG